MTQLGKLRHHCEQQDVQLCGETRRETMRALSFVINHGRTGPMDLGCRKNKEGCLNATVVD